MPPFILQPTPSRPQTNPRNKILRKKSISDLISEAFGFRSSKPEIKPTSTTPLLLSFVVSPIASVLDVRPINGQFLVPFRERPEFHLRARLIFALKDTSDATFKPITWEEVEENTLDLKRIAIGAEDNLWQIPTSPPNPATKHIIPLSSPPPPLAIPEPNVNFSVTRSEEWEVESWSWGPSSKLFVREPIRPWLPPAPKLSDCSFKSSSSADTLYLPMINEESEDEIEEGDTLVQEEEEDPEDEQLEEWLPTFVDLSKVRSSSLLVRNAQNIALGSYDPDYIRRYAMWNDLRMKLLRGRC